MNLFPLGTIYPQAFSNVITEEHPFYFGVKKTGNIEWLANEKLQTHASNIMYQWLESYAVYCANRSFIEENWVHRIHMRNFKVANIDWYALDCLQGPDFSHSVH